MKVLSYKKKKSNIYEVTLSNKDKINLYDDVILKYELLLKEEITEKELLKIVEENKYLESYYAALKFINTKLRTEKEIRKKLKNYSKDVINYTIGKLKKDKYLNDEVYIKAYVNDSVNLKLIGKNKILFELKKLEFKETDILNYLDSIDNEIFLNKIDKYISKRITSNHNLSALMLKQKIIQELVNKGFNREDINIVVDNYDIKDDDAIYEKEYNKIKNKLSKKYKEEELEYRIKIALLKKGYKKDSN